MTLDRITSPALDPVPHGFFGRRGGASSGIFEGLNCGLGSSDQQEVVVLNRARAAGALGLTPEALAGMRQVHSTLAVVVEDAADRPEADALVTDRPGIGLSVVTADCQPVLFADPLARVIGAAHAGWKGALGGVLEATVAAMVDLGASPAHITAVIGPTISQSAYETGPEFRARFLAEDPDSARFFTPSRDGHAQFDLPGYGLERLRRARVGRAEWSGLCTYADDTRFYSCRRAAHRGEADFGRLISIIRL